MCECRYHAALVSLKHARCLETPTPHLTSTQVNLQQPFVPMISVYGHVVIFVVVLLYGRHLRPLLRITGINYNNLNSCLHNTSPKAMFWQLLLPASCPPPIPFTSRELAGVLLSPWLWACLAPRSRDRMCVSQSFPQLMPNSHLTRRAEP